MAYTVTKLRSYSAAALNKAVAELLSASDQEWQAVRSEPDWKALRDRWMARRNGILTSINDLWLKPAPKEAKRDVGQRVNEIKAQVKKDLEKGRKLSESHPIRDEYSSSAVADIPVDITLPGVHRPIGAEHPVIKTLHEMVGVFQRLGYSVADGPVVETDYYNFEALNFHDRQ